jgi:hypothetical protein
MFATEYNSNNEKFSLIVSIKTNGKKKLRVWAEDLGKKNSKYADREIIVDGERSIFFSFPVSPKKLFIGCVNSENVADKDFEVVLVKGQLKDYNIWLDTDTREFLSLAIPFSQVSGFESGSANGKIYTTEDQKFQIKYFDIIRDYASGKILNTPARIGHQTGRIEVAKAKFDKYTVAMRVAILLHEFSHVFKNPKINLEISDEVGADINALYIYLGLGFSKIDAICVYANVFLKAQTKGNVERMRKIMDYISKFENEDFAYRNKI